MPPVEKLDNHLNREIQQTHSPFHTVLFFSWHPRTAVNLHWGKEEPKSQAHELLKNHWAVLTTLGNTVQVNWVFFVPYWGSPIQRQITLGFLWPN